MEFWFTVLAVSSTKKTKRSFAISWERCPSCSWKKNAIRFPSVKILTAHMRRDYAPTPDRIRGQVASRSLNGIVASYARSALRQTSQAIGGVFDQTQTQ